MSRLKWTGSGSPARTAVDSAPWVKTKHATQPIIARAVALT